MVKKKKETNPLRDVFGKPYQKVTKVQIFVFSKTSHTKHTKAIPSNALKAPEKTSGTTFANICVLTYSPSRKMYSLQCQTAAYDYNCF